MQEQFAYSFNAWTHRNLLWSYRSCTRSECWAERVLQNGLEKPEAPFYILQKNEGWWGGPEKQCSLEIKRQTRYVLLLNATEIGKTFPVISCLCFLLHCTCMGQNGALVTAFMNTKLLFVNFFGRRRPSNLLPSATTPSGHLRLDARTKKEHSTLRKHKLWEERLGAKTVAQREEETV